MKILYLDCSQGLKGSALFDALTALGPSQEEFQRQMDQLGFCHDKGDSENGRALFDRIGLNVQKAGLSDDVKTKILAALEDFEGSKALKGPGSNSAEIFQALSLLVGLFVLLELLDVEALYASSIGVGSDACGAPMVPEEVCPLLRGFALCPGGAGIDMAAALLLCHRGVTFGSIPAGTLLNLGTSKNSSLTVWLVSSRSPEIPANYLRGQVVVMESNVDDMSPQDYSPLMARLFDAGALDVFLTPIIMKKNRPGVKVTCIAPVDKRESLGRIMLEHSTTIGLRWHLEDRMTLRRRQSVFRSSWGDVSFKTAFWGDQIVNETAEFEDLREISERTGIPLPNLRNQVMAEYLNEKAEKKRGEGRS